MKVTKRILIFSSLFLITITLGLYFYIVTHEQEIIKAFENEINKNIQTEIHIKSRNITFWDHFPDVSIHIEQVRIKGSNNISEQYLAHFETLDFDFNLIELINKNYQIHKIYASTGGIYIYTNKNGLNNFTFLKENESKEKAEVIFDIKKITLENIDFLYKNELSNQIYSFEKINGLGNFSINDSILNTTLNATSYVENISVGNSKYFYDKNIEIRGGYIHNLNNLNGKLQQTSLKVNHSNFEVNGEIQPKNDRYYFNIGSKKTDIFTILSLLPNSISQPILKYNSSGDIIFSSKILKKTGEENPSINVKFDLKNVKIQEPTTSISVSNLALKGAFSNGKMRSNTTSKLTMENIKGNLHGKPFSGFLEIDNFDDIHFKTDVIGKVDIEPLANFINSNGIINVEKGELNVDFHLDSKLADLKKGSNKNINSFGEIELKNVFFNYKNAPISNLNGVLLFDNNNISANNFNAKIQNSDFKLNGIILNLFSSILHGDKEMQIDLSCSSMLIETDSLIKFFITDNSFEPVDENIKINYRLNVKLDSDTLNFNQFSLKHFNGLVTYHNNIITMPKVEFEEIKGKIELQSKIDFQDKEKIKVDGIAHLEKIDIREMFTLFNNFNQEFIVSANLEGDLSLDLKTSFNLNKAYEIDENSLELTASCLIENGKLINFEPMQELSRFIKRGELENILFSILENTISVKDKILTIPEMDIHSSVSDIVVSGTHSFDQNIDYRLKIPMKNFAAPDKDAAFGAIEESGNSSTIHLKITGTTENYKIAYDTKATSKKINENLKHEFDEFKNLIKGKIEKDTIKQTELEEDEYFDF